MKKNIKINVFLVKTKSMELFKNGQLPFKLVYYIQGIKHDTNQGLVEYLMKLTEEFLRVKGYYHRHKDIEKEYNQLIEKGIKDFFKNP